MMSARTTPATGTAAGVPFVVQPPSDRSVTAPVVVAWHLLDAPRTEIDMAAVLPLEELDCWRIYLGLPMCGERVPDGGPEELMRLAMEDPVVNLQGPIATGAAAEFPAVLAELRDRFGIGDGPLGLVGGSLGSVVAQLVLAEGAQEVSAVALISPIVQLRDSIEATARAFGFDHVWNDGSTRYAERMDFVARADELGPADLLLLVGADDDASGYREPAERLCEAVGPLAALEIVPGMAHALAGESADGSVLATGPSRAVDRRVAAWMGEHLVR